MTKNLTIGIIIIILLGGWLLFRGKSSMAPTIQTENTGGVVQTETPIIDAGVNAGAETEVLNQQTFTVTYDGNGFSPNPLTIKVGDTVRFVNQTSGKMWVASAQHPTHLIYPEFDAKTTVSNGGVYEFTFTKLGTWAYHDHVNAGKFGKITVE